jgi:hypothetical protein
MELEQPHKTTKPDILDRFAVPLIVERREMVRRAEPLVINIFVTALAGI